MIEKSFGVYVITGNGKRLFLKSEKFQTAATPQKKYIDYWKAGCNGSFADWKAIRQDLYRTGYKRYAG